MDTFRLEKHGCVYFLGDKELLCAPLCHDNSVDWYGQSNVEESDKSYKEGHIQALKALGVTDIDYYINKINYY